MENSVKSTESVDILTTLKTPEIIKLKEFYINYKDEYPHVFSFLKNALKWRKTHPEYITIYSVGKKENGNEGWINDGIDGTFIALLTFSCYDIFLHSLDDNSEKLLTGLSQTKLIKWSDHRVLFYALHEKFKTIIYKALKHLNVSIKQESATYLWQINEENALQLEDKFANDDFYLDVVKPEDAEVINEVWPPRYDGSVEYLRTFIIMNGGYGIYEKSTGKLVSWILHNILGQLGVLQTRDGYYKNGFAAAVTRKLSKVIAADGDHAIGTVSDGNMASETLFTKLGFDKKFKCIYIRLEKGPKQICIN